ncbi:lipid asymmetry maintenance protein MlaB [Nitrosovibrio sp. Nv17]|uniref:STAS domain-containing protein n=1 Tax=Nitrosovibrio sp. Nv17 TaxID=1855339 RepID=UPI0009087D11|nr:STAS domain-containing protein [Nitrosovibrio sp. Nv17]SFW31294.1 phospholipid transport system transporter-binding protein [Nitrosovibrio sp. Nv17]
MPATPILSEHGDLALQGPITFDNAAAMMERGLALLNRGEHVIDLAGVTEVDSSALSMLLEWKRAARQRGCTVRFIHLPTALQRLAQLYGVSDLILSP